MPIRKTTAEMTSDAVGYVRVDEDAPEKAAVLLKTVADYCERAGLRLIKTWCDRGYDGTQLARPGVVQIRQALMESDGLTIVVPTLDDLSPVQSIRSPLMLMIHRLGGKLVVVGEVNVTGEDR